MSVIEKDQHFQIGSSKAFHERRFSEVKPLNKLSLPNELIETLRMTTITARDNIPAPVSNPQDKKPIRASPIKLRTFKAALSSCTEPEKIHLEGTKYDQWMLRDPLESPSLKRLINLTAKRINEPYFGQLPLLA
jgi:hypothetical protein